jgi:hypothetical protein
LKNSLKRLFLLETLEIAFSREIKGNQEFQEFQEMIFWGVRGPGKSSLETLETL